MGRRGITSTDSPRPLHSIVLNPFFDIGQRLAPNQKAGSDNPRRNDDSHGIGRRKRKHGIEPPFVAYQSEKLARCGNKTLSPRKDRAFVSVPFRHMILATVHTAKNNATAITNDTRPKIFRSRHGRFLKSRSFARSRLLSPRQPMPKAR
jgi:hypothetical protein